MPTPTSALKPRLAAPLALALVLLASMPAGASAALTVSAKPALTPHFRASTHDYVSRCTPGEPLKLRIRAGRGNTARVAGGPSQSGRFVARVPLRTGERAVIVVRNALHTSRYSIRCLPADFPEWTSERHGTPQSKWFLVTPTIAIGQPEQGHYVAFFDRHGVPVWWAKEAEKPEDVPSDARLLPNGHVVWARRIGTFAYAADPRQRYEEHRLDGSTVRNLKTVGSVTDDHDIAYLPNGNHVLLTYRPRSHVDLSKYGGPSDATIVDGELQELAPDGHVVWTWNTRDHISLDEVVPRWWGAIFAGQANPEGGPIDPVHVNSIEVHGSRVLISTRHTDALYDVDRQTGEVRWKLGGTQRPESLAFENDPLANFGGQHDARVLPDGTVTVHDNGSALDRGPRAVRYRIDEAAHTATLLEQVTDPEVPASFFLGGARRLPRGNWLASWGGSSLVTELAPSGKRVFALRFGKGLISYRAFPVLPEALTGRRLRRGMDVLARRGRAG